MKIDNVKLPESSFLSLEKDAAIIVDKILSNQRLKKLLHYTTRDCMSKPNLTQDESLELFEKNIKLVPELEIDSEVLNYVFILFDDFYTNQTNPEFRDNAIVFYVICHFSQWQLKDFQLRPYRIAAELDSMFSNKRLSGIGKLEFNGASRVSINDEFTGLALKYYAIHGGEDKKFMLNPQDDAQFIEDFKEMVENQ